jgi:phosphatidylserine/phosphatidylglycerophosphate/cardiolipin synthase-like enzyme
MLGLFRRHKSNDIVPSKLFDERSFYPTFLRDINACKHTLIIESPFIARKRMRQLYPLMVKLAQRGVKITVNTRDPREHDHRMRFEAEEAIAALQDTGVVILFTDNHHRKLAIVDARVLYEGSLNILSQNASSEIMRRIESEPLAQEMLDFTKLSSFL